VLDRIDEIVPPSTDVGSLEMIYAAPATAETLNATELTSRKDSIMELRHLRYFVAVAEELHFARAAERLHIEQSPLSRAIRELETDLGVQLFEREPRGTHLTWAGEVFLEDVRRVFTAIDQAKSNVQAAASGYRGTLRIALSDGVIPQRLVALLVLCREQEPDVDIRLSEIPFAHQIKGLRSDLYDAGFARSDEVGEGILSKKVWNDRLVVAVPARHPLLAHKQIPLEQVLRYPLVLCNPEICEGGYRQIERLLRTVDVKPIVGERVATLDLMLALVSAGYGLGFATEAQIASSQHADVRDTRRRPFAATMHARINTLGEQDLGFIPQVAGILQAEGRVRAERHAALLTAPRESDMPELGASGLDPQRQALGVVEDVVFTRAPGEPDGGFRESHRHHLLFQQDLMYVSSPSALHPKTDLAHTPILRS
jgi:DNA-binding transcriptional LysR family regulator